MGRPLRLHLSWRRNRDNFDVAVAVNRLLAHHHSVWWCLRPSWTIEAGDYLLEGSPLLAEQLSALGLITTRWSARLPPGVRRLETPSIALLAGQASAYPHFAYYALCLTRLGLSYDPVSGAEILRDGLHGANLFVLPGGFAIWGLDMSEQSPGADGVVREFLERGGACIGSCGGAYYLSAGRPGWTGTAWTRPRYTHEYLQTGAGIVSLNLEDHRLGVGCPPTIEVPYYHGPIYDEAEPGSEVAAVFDGICLPRRLAIDNPLAKRFWREIAGRPAILKSQGLRRRAVLFSPHPEMGDLVRKYMALDGYVHQYLPIRGHQTMVNTLRAYRPLDSPTFHLILNAAHDLIRAPGRGSPREPEGAHMEVPPTQPLACLRSFRKATDRSLTSLPLPKSRGYGAVVRAVATDLAARLVPAAENLAKALVRLEGRKSNEGRRLLSAWGHLAKQATRALDLKDQSGLSVSERLMHVDLAISLWEGWRRTIEAELLLAPSGPGQARGLNRGK